MIKTSVLAILLMGLLVVTAFAAPPKDVEVASAAFYAHSLFN